jgi:hypothetical protein
LNTDILKAKISEKKGQGTWVESGLPDLRLLDRNLRASPIEELPAAGSLDAAADLVAKRLGFNAETIASLLVKTPIGDVMIRRSSIRHIVEKRLDARERYADVAMDTLTGPLEVSRVGFTDNTFRLAFIGAYETRRQMLVSVALLEGRMLWNFMQCDAKSLNRHRHGELIYKRYTFL